MRKTWFVTSGDMTKVRVRAHTPTEAFLIAVILSELPKALGLLALVVEEGFEDDENHEFYVATDIVTPAIQEIGPGSRYA